MAEAGARDEQRRALVAVLAGGRARRMGVAKASAPLCGRPLICYPLRAARDAGLDAVVVAKRSSELPPLREPVLSEPDRPRHPLCGVVAALRHAGGPVIAVGCDMPFVSADLLRWLGGGKRAVAARVRGRLQPLPALYSPGDLPVLEGALAAQRSMRATLQALGPRIVGEDELAAFGEPHRLCFSVNDARDMRTARGWLEGASRARLGRGARPGGGV